MISIGPPESLVSVSTGDPTVALVPIPVHEFAPTAGVPNRPLTVFTRVIPVADPAVVILTLWPSYDGMSNSSVVRSKDPLEIAASIFVFMSAGVITSYVSGPTTIVSDGLLKTIVTGVWTPSVIVISG